MIAFAGLEPSVNQSGESDKTGKMVKRGSPHLRWAIIQAAKLIRTVKTKHDEQVKS